MSIGKERPFQVVIEIEMNGLSKLKMINTKAKSFDEAKEKAEEVISKEFPNFDIINSIVL